MVEHFIADHPNMQVLHKYPKSGQKNVYRIHDDRYGVVILKIIEHLDERIRREIDIANQGEISGVPRIFESSDFQANGKNHFYILEEYIEGESLSVIIERGPLPIKTVLKLFENLLLIVVELEDLGIVHRDIKPDNIICAEDGSFHLIDFGIARNLHLPSLTDTEASIGPHTPGYGAPELSQYSKLNISSKADLFSIGVVVFQAISGKHPFIERSDEDSPNIWYQARTSISSNLYIPEDIDGQLMALIQTLIQRQVCRRPPSAQRALEWYYAVLDTLEL